VCAPFEEFEMSSGPGFFCWFENGTRDAARTKTFYCELFGWEAVDTAVPGEASGNYTLLRSRGEDVAGLYELSGGGHESVPPHWLSYVEVADADAATARAQQLGATLLIGPYDVPGVGRMSIFFDPTGAHFAMFQPGAHRGAGQTGNLGWVELHTRNALISRRFYTALFGWGAKDDASGAYTEFQVAGRSMAGMMQIPGAQRRQIPDHWLPYALVDDCDEAVDHALRLGGVVIAPPLDLESVGRFAVLKDPGGAHIALIHLDDRD
jgi:predicted enzyme related to lactoylglutathione lyase